MWAGRVALPDAIIPPVLELAQRMLAGERSPPEMLSAVSNGLALRGILIPDLGLSVEALDLRYRNSPQPTIR